MFYLVYPSILFVLFLCYASLSSLELSSVYYHCTVSAPVFQITSLIVVIIIYVASRQWYLLFRKYNSCQHCSVLNCIFLSYMFLYLSTRLYVHPYVRPSVHKSNSDLNKIWFVGRGRCVTNDGMPHDPIQGQDYGGLKCAKMANFKGSLLRLYAMHIIKRLNYDTPSQYLKF